MSPVCSQTRPSAPVLSVRDVSSPSDRLRSSTTTLYELLYASLAATQPDPILREQLVLQSLLERGLDPATQRATLCERRFGWFGVRFRLAEHFAALDGHNRALIIDIHRRIEEREHLVILFVRDGIEFVRMALRAAYGQAEPDRARRADAIHHLFNARLFGIHTTFFVDHRVAVKAGGYEVGFRRVGQ